LSMAVLPNFRNERVYVPLSVETFNVMNEIPNSDSIVRPHMQMPENKKRNMKDFATKVYQALNLSGPACIDVVSYNNEYIVVNVDTSPSLRNDSRFMQALKTTGVDTGHYIHSRIQDEFER